MGDEMLVPSFVTLVNSRIIVPSSRTQYLAVDRFFLQACLQPVVERIRIDESWYLGRNLDVADAVRQRKFANAREHYVQHGYYENRMPYDIKVDERWYLQQYADIREALQQEIYPSAQAHFYAVGFGEGRLPYAGFTLEAVRA